MLTKRKLLSLGILILISTLFLTGCKQADENNQQNNDQVTLIWWNLFESEENVKPLIDGFKTKYPNVVIQYKQQGVSAGVPAYKNLLDTTLNDQDKINDPDIFTIENTWMKKYYDNITSAPNDVISTDYLSDFYPIVKTDFIDSTVNAVPLYVDTLAVIYNKDKLIEAGYSVPDNEWSEFKTQAINLTKKDSSNKILSSGFAAANGTNVQFNFDIFSLLMLQNGVDLTNPDTFKSLESNSEFGDSVDFYQELGTGLTWDKDQKLDVAAFLEGRLAMFIAPSWRLNDVLIYNEEYNLNLDIGIAPLPQLAGTDATYWGTYWGQTVSKNSPHSKIAWEFVKYITETEQLKTLDSAVKESGRKVGIFFPRESMAGDISNDEYLKVYVQSMPFARSWQMYDGYLMEQEFNKYFNEGNADLTVLESNISVIINQSE